MRKKAKKIENKYNIYFTLKCVYCDYLKATFDPNIKYCEYCGHLFKILGGELM